VVVVATRVTITLDDEILAFVDKQAQEIDNKGNRSAFINEVLKEFKKQRFEEELKAAYIKDSQDKAYLEEIALWDVVISDGIE
jgi:metal-responsive CopG/Arc/MetJ family transcriptional regulator